MKSSPIVDIANTGDAASGVQLTSQLQALGSDAPDFIRMEVGGKKMNQSFTGGVKQRQGSDEIRHIRGDHSVGVCSAMQAQQPSAENVTLFLNVRVFDGKSATLSAPSNVLAKGNTTERVSRSPIDASAIENVTAINGQGRIADARPPRRALACLHGGDAQMVLMYARVHYRARQAVVFISMAARPG